MKIPLLRDVLNQDQRSNSIPPGPKKPVQPDPETAIPPRPYSVPSVSVSSGTEATLSSGPLSSDLLSSDPLSSDSIPSDPETTISLRSDSCSKRTFLSRSESIQSDSETSVPLRLDSFSSDLTSLVKISSDSEITSDFFNYYKRIR